ncbi:DUF881 domain-containing protein [Parafrankia discariae]|uniref:DUF881 domain-containing protein n=1 Tax=Parafrankia discariae TaxID=365528 RepID=UPI00037511F4
MPDVHGRTRLTTRPGGGGPPAGGPPAGGTATGGTATTVFERIAAEALEPGYARAAGARGGGWAGRLLLPLTLLLAGLLIALSVRQAVDAGPSRERLRARLSAEYETRSTHRDDLAASVAVLRSATEDLVNRRRTADGLWAAAKAEIDALAAPAGLAPARGPGARVTLADPSAGPPADAGNPRPAAQGPDGRLADHDLADMVNALWATGAEAVAVNGIRLTALSAVRAAGDTILVGLSPVEAPYVVDVVGDPDTIVPGVGAAAVTVRLRTRMGAPPNAVTVARLDDVTVPAAPSPSLRYARGSGS